MIYAEYNQTNFLCNQDNSLLPESFSNAERCAIEQVKHYSNSWNNH